MNALKSFLFIAAVIALLGVVAYIFPRPSVEFRHVELRFAHLEDYIPSTEQSAPRPLADSIIHVVEELILPDSAEQARRDTLLHYEHFFALDPARFVLPEDDVTFFDQFFLSLDSARLHPMHIMHYGDSQIEGDRISGYVRERLQERFGGSGPGLIPMIQKVSSHAVSQLCSDSLASYYAGGMMGGRASVNHYGAMGQFARLDNDEATLNVRALKARNFQKIKVFVGDVDDEVAVRVAGVEKTFQAGVAVQSATWTLQKSVNNIDLHFVGSGSVLGIAIDGLSGVSLSNIPMRGSDGTFISRIDSEAFGAMLRELDTRMIILEFGGNALPSIAGEKGVESYCKSLQKQIAYVKRHVPEACVVVIGPADMTEKKDGELRTYTLLPYLVEKMCEASTQSGAAFWNMYEVMGGYNSMISWVEHEPRWAAPDYIHFTQKGVAQIARVLWQSLQKYYEYYQLRNE